MPLPPRRKRCSFGGKEGVWWRRKKSTSEATIKESSFKDSDSKHGPKAEWDANLSRPIDLRKTVGDEDLLSSEGSKAEFNGHLPGLLDFHENPKSFSKRVRSPSERNITRAKRIKPLNHHQSHPLSLRETLSVATKAPFLVKLESPGSVSTSSSLGSFWDDYGSDRAEGRTSICLFSPRASPSRFAMSKRSTLLSPLVVVSDNTGGN